MLRGRETKAKKKEGGENDELPRLEKEKQIARRNW